ncbi:MAG: T9SS type A sorting domain-containing protein, partial [Bacteroidetes bacterium]|nr:T9SS type A sorting domain-containing protein [Bacteroidota bacterium]
YFYDNDPGFGNGTDIPVTSATNINSFLVNVSVANITSGIHTLYIRSRDAQGKWSMTNTLNFTKIQSLQPNPHIVHYINKLEYFYDNDPGFGNGINVPITPGINISNLVVNTNVTTLANGVHTLYFRSRDSAGQWSITNSMMFAKVQMPLSNPHTVSNIVQAEYYYDSDPGFGNGASITLTPSTQIVNLNFNANVANINNGVHTLYIRTKDLQGKWSETNSLTFAKVKMPLGNPYTRTNITTVEYFVDTDPGFGNGIQVPITPDTNIANLSFNVNMALLVNSAHKLYIRSKDSQGKWSITNIHLFNGGTAPLGVKILAFEAKLQKDRTVLLDWQTAEEKNVDRYEVERSYDATNWTFVGSSKPQTSQTNETKDYQLIDSIPGKGIVYYRLTEYDWDGSTTQAPIRFVKIGDYEPRISNVFPNPNSGERIHISSDIFKDGEVLLTIASANGKMVFQQLANDNLTSVITINNLKLASGDYFINLVSKDHSESLKLQIIGEGL